MVEGGAPEDQSWMKDELQRFNDEHDANKDGRLDEDEVKQWLLPDFHKVRAEEVDHLMTEADENKVLKMILLSLYGPPT